MKNNLIGVLEPVHKPVLLKEVLAAFEHIAPLNNQAHKGNKPIVVDATLGAGGHAKELIRRGFYVLGIDENRKMVKIAGENLRNFVTSEFAHRAERLSEPEACPTGNFDEFFKIVTSNFVSIDRVAHESGFENVDGILFDLGISSYHYQFSSGFSFQNPDLALDMRLSDSQNVTAADLLNALPYKKLAELFAQTIPGKAKRLARCVEQSRRNRKIETVGDFLKIVDSAIFITKRMVGKNQSPYTLPFLALRIAVNYELDNLKIALNKSCGVLKDGGVLAVISFHSGEDKIVKDIFKDLVEKKLMKWKEKLVIPSTIEILNNPRSRSAKLRVISRL